MSAQQRWSNPRGYRGRGRSYNYSRGSGFKDYEANGNTGNNPRCETPQPCWSPPRANPPPWVRPLSPATSAYTLNPTNGVDGFQQVGAVIPQLSNNFQPQYNFQPELIVPIVAEPVVLLEYQPNLQGFTDSFQNNYDYLQHGSLLEHSIVPRNFSFQNCTPTQFPGPAHVGLWIPGGRGRGRGGVRGSINRVHRPFDKRPQPYRRELAHVMIDQVLPQVSKLPRNPVLLGLPPPEIPKILYHYTTLENLDTILKRKALYPKAQQEGVILKTARFGPGIYFTDIEPHERTDLILKNNYGIGKVNMIQAKRTEVCFEFFSKDLKRLVFCEDRTCFLQGSTERDRKIWQVPLSLDDGKLDLYDLDGFYYIREVFDLGDPKSVTKRRWHDD